MTAQALISRLRELDKAATAGPWSSGASRVFNCQSTIASLIADHRDLSASEWDAMNISTTIAQQNADAALIAEMRTALPVLLERIEALEAALKPFAEELGRFGIGNSSAHVELRLSGRRAIPNLDLSVAHFEQARAALGDKA